MKTKAIESDDEHVAALREIERLWGTAPGTKDGDKLDTLVTLVERYETHRWPTIPDR